MSTQQHPKIDDHLVGAYVLGILDSSERAAIDEHTTGCKECRMELVDLQEMKTALGEVPSEAFLEGAPEGGDLLLQRTIRQVRAEQAGVWRRRSLVIGLGAAASAAILFFGGYAVGGHGPTHSMAGPSSPSKSTTSSLTDVRVASATDTTTRAAMWVQFTPASGWVKVKVAATGVPGGERCRLVVVSTDGKRETALSWVTPLKRAPSKLPPVGQGGLDGAAAVEAREVKEVILENEQGKAFVRAVPS